MSPKILSITIPEYHKRVEPDDKAIGKKLDDLVKEHFMGRKVLVRGIDSSDHRKLPIDDLIRIIKFNGTDRYKPSWKGDRYENVENKKIDLFAFPASVTPDAEIFSQMIWGFYHSAKGYHGKPKRIDIIIVYDASKLEVVSHQYEGRDDIKYDGFIFKDPEKKTESLLGIIKVL